MLLAVDMGEGLPGPRDPGPSCRCPALAPPKDSTMMCFQRAEAWEAPFTALLLENKLEPLCLRTGMLIPSSGSGRWTSLLTRNGLLGRCLSLEQGVRYGVWNQYRIEVDAGVFFLLAFHPLTPSNGQTSGVLTALSCSVQQATVPACSNLWSWDQ